MVDETVDDHIRRIDAAVLDIQRHAKPMKRDLPRLRRHWTLAWRAVETSYDHIEAGCTALAATCRAMDAEVPDAALQAELLLA